MDTLDAYGSDDSDDPSDDATDRSIQCERYGATQLGADLPPPQLSSESNFPVSPNLLLFGIDYINLNLNVTPSRTKARIIISSPDLDTIASSLDEAGCSCYADLVSKQRDFHFTSHINNTHLLAVDEEWETIEQLVRREEVARFKQQEHLSFVSGDVTR